MSAVLITTALVIALACVPSIAALTAMGLAGGDGEPRNAFFGILGAVVGYGSVYNGSPASPPSSAASRPGGGG
jgi:hypothetical protein